MKLSIIVPVYNEAENITLLLDEITAALQQVDTYEIIYVDDGSTDQTKNVLKQAQQHINNLRVIYHKQTYGQSAAIYTGVKAARYPVIATLDGDGQNDPANIVELYNTLLQQQKIDNKLAMIAGWRTQRHDSTWRLFSSKIANGFRATVLGDKTPDTGCGLKVFYKDTFLQLPYFDHMHRFLPALVLRAGRTVLSVPVNHRPRAKGKSKYGTFDRLWVGIVDIMGVVWLQKRAKFIEASE